MFVIKFRGLLSKNKLKSFEYYNQKPNNDIEYQHKKRTILILMNSFDVVKTTTT